MAKTNAPAPKGSRQQVLDTVGVETICQRIEAGEAQAEIAGSLDVSIATLSEWLNGDPERSARARIARQVSAEGWMDRALSVLADIPDDGSTAQISRAKELAQHCRKMAAIRNPAGYGDKIDVRAVVDSGLSVSALLACIPGQGQLIPLPEDAILIEPIP